MDPKLNSVIEYVLDCYSPLWHVSQEIFKSEQNGDQLDWWLKMHQKIPHNVIIKALGPQSISWNWSSAFTKHTLPQLKSRLSFLTHKEAHFKRKVSLWYLTVNISSLYIMCELPHITKTTKLQYLNWHLESEHEVDIYDCSLCEYTTQIESNFITHTKTEHFESQEKSDNII